MKYSLDMTVLAERLKSAPQRKQPDYAAELNEISTGAAYLLNFCILPMLDHQKPVLSEIETDRFDREDIEIMFDYFNEKTELQEDALKPVFEFGKVIRSANPKPVSVGFI